MLSADPLETGPCVSVCVWVGDGALLEARRGPGGVVGGVWGEEELSIS